MRKWHVTFLAIKVLGVSNQFVSGAWISFDESFWLKAHLLEENRRKKLLHWSKYEYFIICSQQLLSTFLAKDENHDDRSIYFSNRSIHRRIFTLLRHLRSVYLAVRAVLPGKESMKPGLCIRASTTFVSSKQRCLLQQLVAHCRSSKWNCIVHLVFSDILQSTAQIGQLSSITITSNSFARFQQTLLVLTNSEHYLSTVNFIEFVSLLLQRNTSVT